MTIAIRTAGAAEPAHDFREPISSAPERLRPTEQTSGRRSSDSPDSTDDEGLSRSPILYGTHKKLQEGIDEIFSNIAAANFKPAGEILVRSSGFEPPRYCYRQPLKLMRLPVPPRPHIEKHEERYRKSVLFLGHRSLWHRLLRRKRGP